MALLPPHLSHPSLRAEEITSKTSSFDLSHHLLGVKSKTTVDRLGVRRQLNHSCINVSGLSISVPHETDVYDSHRMTRVQTTGKIWVRIET